MVLVYLGLFLLCLILRLPSFAVPFLSDDEAAYAAMARILQAGGKIYRDAVDHKPPMTVWLYSGVFQLFGAYNMIAIHLLLVVWVYATAWVLGAVAEHYAGRRARWWAMLFYLLFSTTLRDYDALAANNELLMNLPIVLGVYACIKNRAFWSGLLIGFAMTIKYQAIFPGAALFSYLMLRRDWKHAGWLLTGGLCAGALLIGVLLAQGVWPDFLYWGIGFNTHYIGQGLGAREAALRLLRRSLEGILPALLVWLLAIWSVVREGSYKGLLGFWLLASLAAMFLGGRFFGHYFLQPLAPLAVLAGLEMPRLWELTTRSRVLRILLLIGLVIPGGIFFTLAVRREQLLRIVNEREPDYASVGRRVQELTRPTDTIFVWTNSPQIYYYAHRTPGTRFTFCNYQTGQSPATPAEEDPAVDTTPYMVLPAWEMLMADLETNRPKMFVDATHAHFDDFGKSPLEKFPRLAQWVWDHYDLVDQVKGVRLFQLKAW